MEKKVTEGVYSNVSDFFSFLDSQRENAICNLLNLVLRGLRVTIPYTDFSQGHVKVRMEFSKGSVFTWPTTFRPQDLEPEKVFEAILFLMQKLKRLFKMRYLKCYHHYIQDHDLLIMEFYYFARKIQTEEYRDWFLAELAFNLAEDLGKSSVGHLKTSEALIKALMQHRVVQTLIKWGKIHEDLAPKVDWDDLIKSLHRALKVSQLRKCPVCGKTMRGLPTKKVCSPKCRLRKSLLYRILRRKDIDLTSKTEVLCALIQHLDREKRLGRLRKKIYDVEALADEFVAAFSKFKPG